MSNEQPANLVANRRERPMLNLNQLAVAHRVDAIALAHDFQSAVIAGIESFELSMK
jgi:hypothetical protein